jgi:hypothetical protein
MSSRRFRFASAAVLALVLATPARAQEHDHAAMIAGSSTNDSPRLEMHGFFDVTLSAARMQRANGDTTSLGAALGQFDLFLSSRIADRVSFLGELVVESELDGGSAVELERAYVRYAFSDRLRVAAGRTHSAVSDWYVTCHHGALLQPTIQRPAPVRFEDEEGGGYLPAHAVGLELTGSEALGDYTFDWVANVANGRGDHAKDVQTTGDRNRDKQIGASISLSSRGALQWRAGAALFHDRTAASPITGGETDQEIASLHLSFKRDWVEQTGEWFAIRDRDRLTFVDQHQHLWYSVMAFGNGAWRPYAAVEGVRVDRSDPYYADRTDLDRLTLGLRHDLNPFNAIRVEYRNALDAGVRTHEVLVQTAFTF